MNGKINISYRFDFEDGTSKSFTVTIDRENLLIENAPHFSDWAKIENFRCKNCPLKNAEYCPLALRLPEIIDFFSNIYSYRKTKITVSTEPRNYVREGTVQEGLSALLGVIMPVSGCPVFAKLKPLVPFHLPFATPVETEFRVISTYLFAQYLRAKNGLQPDWQLNGLRKIYNDIQIVNRNIAEQVRTFSLKDANLNAVAILDTFSSFITMTLENKDFEDYSNYFQSFFNDKA